MKNEEDAETEQQEDTCKRHEENASGHLVKWR